MSDTGSRSPLADPPSPDPGSRCVALDLDGDTLVYERERPTA